MTVTSVIAILSYCTDIFFCIRAIRQKDSRIYALTKSLLMPLLLLLFVSFLPGDSVLSPVNMFIATALVFHTLGDILLLFPKGKTKVPFYCGMLSFLVGHFFYTESFLVNNLPSSKSFAIGALAVIVILEYFFYRQLVLGARRYAPLFLPYSFGLALLIIVISSQLGSNPAWYANAISLIGTVFFAFSDYCIARREMRMPIAGQLTVMPTYIAGQTLIVLGALLNQLI